MAGGPRIRIKVESPTSEFYTEVRGNSTVKELMKIIIKVWGDEYMSVYHKSTKMKSDQPLSAYNIKDGSIVKIKVFAEPPEEPVSVIQIPKRDCPSSLKLIENNNKCNLFGFLWFHSVS
ncbi:hypothetical protein A4A49_61373 [Nicotiana attenuata]|uniref:Ubiquitin-like domain-containing protein n=1 Tax=Nicotiana attenuata TaxID=49451 RepID=A0A1J6IL60_NICAT|nr:hypothetical protein A4A49_54723 [Nicotiana attenuata]OIT05877.1 hypothetical protein A4A49_61373 [Nicotiana attenuata]